MSDTKIREKLHALNMQQRRVIARLSCAFNNHDEFLAFMEGRKQLTEIDRSILIPLLSGVKERGK